MKTAYDIIKRPIVMQLVLHADWQVLLHSPQPVIFFS